MSSASNLKSQRQTALKLRISQSATGEVNIENLSHRNSHAFETYLPSLSVLNKPNVYSNTDETSPDGLMYDPEEIFNDLASENEDKIEEVFEFDIDGQSIDKSKPIDIENDLPRNFFSTYQYIDAKDKSNAIRTNKNSKKISNLLNFSINENGLTQYPASSSSVRRTNYQKSIDTQFETFYTQYRDSKIGPIVNDEFDSNDQVIFKDQEYMDDNRKGLTDAIVDIKNSEFSENPSAMASAINNFKSNPLLVIPEYDDQNENEYDSESNQSSEDNVEAFDSQSIHKMFNHSVFQPKSIDIRKKNEPKQKKSNNSQINHGLANSHHIDPNKILYQRCKDKSDEYERKKLLKQIKKENRMHKKQVSLCFKASELSQKQNIFALKQHISSFKF